MELISIILPVYKAEKCLSKCIDSILAQTYENFELILVDDGSPDNSGKICDEYAEKDKRIKVIHKENGGVSSARNVGLDNAKGENITFVDADDVAHKKYLEVLYDNLKKYDADISWCSYNNIYKDQCLKSKEHTFNYLAIDFSDSKFVEYFKSFFSYCNSPSTAVWGKLFTKKSIENIRFDEKIKIAEDKLFLLESLRFAKKMCFSNECVYDYIIDSASAFHSYKIDYLVGQKQYYFKLCELFSHLGIREDYGFLLGNYSSLLVYLLLTNELKYKKTNPNYKDNIAKIKRDEIYKKFKLFKGFKNGNIKFKIKFLMVWLLVKFHLY